MFLLFFFVFLSASVLFACVLFYVVQLWFQTIVKPNRYSLISQLFNLIGSLFSDDFNYFALGHMNLFMVCVCVCGFLYTNINNFKPCTMDFCWSFAFEMDDVFDFQDRLTVFKNTLKRCVYIELSSVYWRIEDGF